MVALDGSRGKCLRKSAWFLASQGQLKEDKKDHDQCRHSEQQQESEGVPRHGQVDMLTTAGSNW